MADTIPWKMGIRRGIGVHRRGFRGSVGGRLDGEVPAVGVDAIGSVENVESGNGRASSVIASGEEGPRPTLAQRVAVELGSRA